jgi:type II secretory pathway pseudopilin PulG
MDSSTPLRQYRRRLESERGLTMVELLVAMMMMVLITGATVSLFVSTIKDQSKVTKRADQVGDARLALQKMIVEIRQGEAVTTATAAKMVITTYVHATTSCTGAASATAPAIKCAVTYEAAKEGTKSTYELKRTVAGGTAAKVITGMSSSSIFEYTPTTTPTYVSAKITLPSSTGNSPTTLESGAALRNSPTNLAY